MRGQKNDVSSFANNVRELVELGLRIEEVAAKNNGKENESSNTIEGLGELKILWERALNWGLETRYLLRYLIENSLTDNKEKHVNFLNQAKEKAQAHVQGLLRKNE